MRYCVLVPEFRFEGRVLGPGDTIETRDTNEILTNIALGRLAPDTGGSRSEEPRPSVSSLAAAAEPQPKPEPHVMTTDDAPTASRRRYTRRDLQSE